MRPYRGGLGIIERAIAMFVLTILINTLIAVWKLRIIPLATGLLVALRTISGSAVIVRALSQRRYFTSFISDAHPIAPIATSRLDAGCAIVKEAAISRNQRFIAHFTSIGNH